MCIRDRLDTVRLGKRNPLEMLYLNRKFVCPAETAHDVGKVDGGEESEQVKDDNPDVYKRQEQGKGGCRTGALPVRDTRPA